MNLVFSYLFIYTVIHLYIYIHTYITVVGYRYNGDSMGFPSQCWNNIGMSCEFPLLSYGLISWCHGMIPQVQLPPFQWRKTGSFLFIHIHIYIYMLRGPSGAYIFKRISTYNYNKSNCYMNELTKQKTHLSNEHLFHLQCLCLNVISHCIHFCHPRVVTANKNSSVQWTPLPSTMPLSECHFSLHSLLPSESRHCKQLCYLPH